MERPLVGQLRQVDPNAQVGGGSAPRAAVASGRAEQRDRLAGATQASATTASEQLATGQLSDPTQAVTAVENASLEMDFASQLQSKLVSDATNIFSTTI